jgi:hypothetical protein
LVNSETVRRVGEGMKGSSHRHWKPLVTDVG